MLRSVLPLGFIAASRFFGLFIILPVLSLYALELDGANEFLAGLTIGAYAITQMIFQLPFGSLSDRFGRKFMIFVGLIIFIIGSLICAISTDIYTMLFGRLLQGCGAVGAVATAMISDLVSEDKRSKAMAMMGGMIGIAFAISMILSPLLSREFGLSSLFYLSIIVTIFWIFLLFSAVPKEPKIHHHDPKIPLTKLLKQKDLGDCKNRYLDPITSRLTNPAFNYKEAPIDRFYNLNQNPQDNIFWNFAVNTDLEAKDNFKFTFDGIKVKE